MSKRPNFFVIGAHKAATSNFCRLITTHPDVFVCSPKEPNYFSDPDRMEVRATWYRGLFSEVKEEAAIGEGSTLYSQRGVFPGTADRIKEYSPDARIIYLVRHPLRRIESGWMQYRSQGRQDVPADFSRAVREVPQLLDATRYWSQVSEYRDRFENVMVLFFEDFIADIDSNLDSAFTFLGVDPASVSAVRKEDGSRNASSTKRDPGLLLRATTRIPGNRRMRLLKRVSRSRLIDGLVKDALRTLYDRLLTRPLRRPQWDFRTYEFVRASLADDTARFLSAYGKPQDYWDLGWN